MSTPDTPATTLRDDEREALLGALIGWAGEAADLDDCRSAAVYLTSTVERIVAARVARAVDNEHDKVTDQMLARVMAQELRAERAEAKVRAVEALINPPCTCPGACSGPPRKVHTGDLRAALTEGPDR